MNWMKSGRRFRFPFSLRTFFVVLSISLLWLGYNLQVAERQRAACERVRQFDGFREGYITYAGDWDMSTPGVPRRKSVSLVRDWMRTFIGDDFLQPVSFIGAPGATDDLSWLRSFPDLQALTLEQSDVKDNSLKELTNLPKLRYLWLDETQISDEAVQYIGQLSELRELYIRDTNVTPQGLSQLKTKLPSCNIYLSTETVRRH